MLLLTAFCGAFELGCALPHSPGPQGDILSAQERAWLTENQPDIVLAVETGYAPFVYLDEMRQPVGFAHDYLRLVESKLGISFRQKEFVSLSDILDKAAHNEVDIVNAVTKTLNRSAFLAFTKPFITVPNIILVRKERSARLREQDLSGLNVSLVKSYAVTEYLTEHVPGLKPDLVSDDNTALLNVSFGHSDAAVVDLATASFFIESKGITNLTVAGEVNYPIQLSMAVPLRETMLRDILQKGINAITDAESRAIRDAWVGLSRPSLLADRRLWAALATILLALAGFVAWNRALTRQVTLRTAALLSEKESVRKSEERHRAILATAMDGIWRTDHQGRILEVNATYCKMSGYGAEELLAMHAQKFDAPESAGDTIAHLRQVMLEGEGRFETRHRRKDGTLYEVEISAQYQKEEGGQYIVFLRDITERKRLEEQLLQSQKMEAVGQLAGGVAHDFNNILQVILGNVDLLLEEPALETLTRETVNEIGKAAQRAANLTRQLLAFSRRQIINPVAVDLNTLIGDALKMLERVIGEHIALNFVPGECLAPVCVDRGQTEQVLMNLCLNARDAMPQGGLLTIATSSAVLDEEFCREHHWASPGRYTCLSVTDNGQGMHDDILKHIFEPFFTTKHVGKGTGLGLATVYGIVEHHNGLLRVHSQQGMGSTFQVYLPVHESPVEQAPASIDPREAAQFPKGTETILVAEDDPAVLRLVVMLLEQAGYIVLAAKDGMEALRLWDEHRNAVDLTILDVIMPGMGGRKVMDYILAEGGKTAFLFSSGYSDNAIHTNFVVDEGLNLIQKPYARDILLREVRRMLDARKTAYPSTKA